MAGLIGLKNPRGLRTLASQPSLQRSFSSLQRAASLFGSSGGAGTSAGGGGGLGGGGGSGGFAGSTTSDRPNLLNSGSSISIKTATKEEEEFWEVHDDEGEHLGSRFALREGSPFRAAWELAVGGFLIYTGTIFLYRVVFIELHIPEPLPEYEDGSYAAIDTAMNLFFWVDLFLCFLFTFRDHRGVEVDSLRKIAKHYMCGYFVVNLIALTPEVLVKSLLRSSLQHQLGGRSSLGHATAIVRLLRLQRLSRLARLPRLVWFLKVLSARHVPSLTWLEHARWMRVLNNAAGLLWMVHLLACGWYLNAAFHEDPTQTWVGRRCVDTEGEIQLLYRPPLDQWMHSFYFILTVFTTVGFGDMSAVTLGEIVYVCVTMMLGAVFHSIIISEVINIIRSVDKTHAFIAKQTEIIDAFAEHAQMDETSHKLMTAWIAYSAKGWMSSRFDREEVKALITDKCMPRSLLGRLPMSLFGGALVKNSFLAIRGSLSEVPPRLPLLLALAVNHGTFGTQEIVYQKRDLAMNVFLVISGTFADVARPSPSGGIDEAVESFLEEENAVFVDMHQKSSKNPSPRTPAGAAAVPASSAKSPAPAVLKRQSTFHVMNAKPRSHHLHPYKLYGAGSFFGLDEVLDASERASTLRCESEGGGAVLMLSRPELDKLMEVFPYFALAWRSESRRRESHRQRLLSQLTSGGSFRRVAAVRLQQGLRAFLAAKRGEQGPGGASDAFGGRLANAHSAKDIADRMTSYSRAVAAANAGFPTSEDSAIGMHTGPSFFSSGGGGATPAAASAHSEAPRLLAASKAQARELKELRHHVDAMRSEFAALRGELRAAIGGGGHGGASASAGGGAGGGGDGGGQKGQKRIQSGGSLHLSVQGAAYADTLHTTI